MHHLFAFTGLMPEARPALDEMVRFAIDHTLFLNSGFLLVAGALLWLNSRGGTPSHGTRHARHAEA